MEIFYCKQDDSIFPQLLKDIKNSPKGLYYCGDISILNKIPCLAIVGSRAASANGRKIAFEFGRMAAEKGFVVVNGLAVGCDTHALMGALSINGKCATVMPGGLDAVYPRSNIDLSQEILHKGGCLISEYGVGVRPQKHTFVNRDRLQSGLSQGVVVIETTQKGGTMHTVDFAEAQGRRLACYYSKISQMESGNRIIIDNYDGVPVENEDDMERFLKELKSHKTEHYEQLTLDIKY